MQVVRSNRKIDEIKHCGFCGKMMSRKRLKGGVLESNLHFRRRKFCDRLCMRKSFTMRGGQRSTESNSRASARLRMELLIGLNTCQKCGSTDNLDVHHIDENPFNNDLENLTLLCRSCHMKEHRGGRKCSICDGKHKGLGYCDKHYQRFKKYGDPHFKKEERGY